MVYDEEQSIYVAIKYKKLYKWDILVKHIKQNGTTNRELPHIYKKERTKKTL